MGITSNRASDSCSRALHFLVISVYPRHVIVTPPLRESLIHEDRLHMRTLASREDAVLNQKVSK